MPSIIPALQTSFRATRDARRLRGNGFVAARVVFGAVREEVVDEHSDEGEEEDDKAPDDLVERRAVGLDDLNYARLAMRRASQYETGRKGRTPCDDVEDEDDESDDAAAGRTLPVRRLDRDGCSLDKQGERELEEGGESELEHDDGGSGMD